MTDGSTNKKPSNKLACPRCQGPLECYKTFPRTTRVIRVKQCRSCKAKFETIETFKDYSVTGNQNHTADAIH